MAWGRTPSEERAAEEANDMALMRARARAQMSPFEREVVAVLGDIRDALRVLLAEPDCSVGTETAAPQNNP